MAPETILGHPADVRSDIYSFGATVYFALTGRLAFQDDSTLALFAAHVSRPIGSMSAVSPRPIPAVFERVVQRCMAKDPADRFASTREVLEALASIAAERAPAPNAWHERARG
jgi:serine/threonine-protein kinase